MSKKYRKILDLMVPKRFKVLHTAYHRMPHYAYLNEALDSVKVQHLQPNGIKDKIAHYSIQVVRKLYDTITRYDPQKMTINRWVQRCIFLETVAGVPGMVAGMARHLRSLRLMERDRGWIHHLLEQADNERFHLFIFLNMKQPGILQRISIIMLQGVFFNFFFIAYLMGPKFCHRFVGYLEQQAVKTYTSMLEDIDNPDGVLRSWVTIPAPKEAIDYYRLNQDANYRDIIRCIRADQATHRGVNHFLGSIDQDEELQQQTIEVINEKANSDYMKLKDDEPKITHK